MIKRIGFQKTVTLLILIGIACAAFFLDYSVLSPQTARTKAQADTVSSEISTLTGQLQTMRSDYEKFERKRALFETMKYRGFFNSQERIAARQRLDTIQRLSNVISARYEIRAANIVNDDNVKDTDYVIVQTPVSVSISALTDIDIYRFIYYLNYAYPGNVSLETVSIKRVGDVTQQTLREIGTGRPQSIVDAQVDFIWTTMATRESMMLPPVATGSAAPVSDTSGVIVPMAQEPQQ